MSAARSTDPLHAFCRSLPGTTEDIKWGNDIVFSVGGKMYAVFPLDGGESCSFKVDPMAFQSLVAREGIVPAPYAARFSWISVMQRRALPAATLRAMIAESHRLVALSLPKKTQAALGVTSVAAPGPQAPAAKKKSAASGALADGASCVVIAGTHKGKRGTVRDINTSKTGAVTITVVQPDGERFKTLAKNVTVQK